MDDATLWKRWTTAQDAEAFAEIVSRHASMVHAVSRRILRSAADAEDVAQECFLELLRARPVVGSSLGGLLHTLAVRRSLDRLKADARRRDREIQASDRLAAERDSGSISPIEREEREELARLLATVDESIRELPPELGDAIVLRFLEGKTTEAAAALLGIAESTVRLRIARGVSSVRSALRRRGIVVTEALLAAALGREALEAAPLTLVAALGKIALSGGVPAGASATRAVRAVHRSSRGLVAGALAMKKISVAVALLLLLIAGGWAHHGLSRRAARRLPSPVETVAETSVATRELATTPGDDAVGRETDASQSAPSPPGETEGKQLDILCLDAGQPAGEAEVFLVERFTRTGSGAAWSVSHGPRTTDDAGRVRFDGLPSQEGLWRVEVFARARGRLAGLAAASLTRENLEAGAEPLVVRLATAADLAGRVRTPDGYSPTTVRIRATGISLRDESSPFGESLDAAAAGPLAQALETRADGDGAFAFHDIPAGAVVHLEADAPGLARAVATAEPPRERDPIELELLPEGTIEGTVLFAASRAPAPGTRLEAELIPGTGRSAGSFHAVADAAGEFRFEGLAPGAYSITLPAHPGPGEWTLRIAGPIRVSTGGTAGDVALLLETGGVISGTVRDGSTGAPVPGICIAALGPDESGKRPLGGAVSDGAGHYSLRLPPGEPTLYIASHVPEYVYPADQGKRGVALGSGEEIRGVDFELERRVEPERPIDLGRARGRVLDPLGRPLPQVRVRTFTLHDPARPILGLYNRTVLTDAAGRYESRVPAGPRVFVEAGGQLFSLALAEPFSVSKDEEHLVEDLVVRAASGTLEGLVVGADGAPIADAAVRASSRSKTHEGDPVSTDAGGRFRVERLLEDELAELTIEKDGYATFRLDGLQPGPVELRVVLQPAGAGELAR